VLRPYKTVGFWLLCSGRVERIVLAPGGGLPPEADRRTTDIHVNPEEVYDSTGHSSGAWHLPRRKALGGGFESRSISWWITTGLRLQHNLSALLRGVDFRQRRTGEPPISTLTPHQGSRGRTRIPKYILVDNYGTSPST